MGEEKNRHRWIRGSGEREETVVGRGRRKGRNK